MPLALIKIGERARVMSVSGNDAVRKHLGNLGLIPGSVVAVVQVSDGNMIVGIQDSRIALNDELARRIHVEPL